MSDNEAMNAAQTKEISMKIVKMYSERPILWNPHNQYYRVTSMKLEAWQEIADECGIDVTNMRRKMNSLLASYRRERQRIRQGKRSHWYLYDAMKFIPNHVPNRISKFSNSTRTDDAEFVHEGDFDEETEITYEDDDDDSVQYFDIPTQDIFVKEEEEDVRKPKKMRTIYVTPDKTPPKTKFIKVHNERTESYSEKSHEIVNPIESIVYKSSNEDGKDECDVFGEYIAKSLRKHNDKTRAMIKQAINNIIYEEEMRKYDTVSHVV